MELNYNSPGVIRVITRLLIVSNKVLHISIQFERFKSGCK